jgi:branched-chain amino acid transport system substrate-binding protein
MLAAVLARSPRRVCVRTLAVVAGAVTIAALSGCAAAGTTTLTATGTTLTVYLSAPSAAAAAGPVSADVLDAEQLAFTQKAGQVTAFKLSMQRLENGKLSDSARTAIENTAAIAYVGEIEPGASADSLGITNARDLLQVAPTDTASALTEPTSAVSDSPNRYYESLKTYGRTFARVVPNTVHEAKVQLQEMHSLGVKQLYATGDGSDYAKAFLASIRADAPSAGVSLTSAASGSDGVFYAGTDPSAAARVFSSAAGANPRIKLFAPSALSGAALPGALTAGKSNLYVSTPGFLPKDLNAAGKAFVSAFTAAYHHAPAPQAIFGYEAMASVLDVLKEAGGSANNRSTVVKDYFSIKNRSSVLGTYSINANGDISVAPYVFERYQAGALRPFKFVPAQG